MLQLEILCELGKVIQQSRENPENGAEQKINRILKVEGISRPVLVPLQP